MNEFENMSREELLARFDSTIELIETNLEKMRRAKHDLKSRGEDVSAINVPSLEQVMNDFFRLVRSKDFSGRLTTEQLQELLTRRRPDKPGLIHGRKWTK